MGSRPKPEILKTNLAQGGESTQKKIVLAITLALMILSAVAPVVFAQEETPPEVPYQAVQAIWALAKATPIALVMAFATVAAGYLSKTKPTEFKLENFVFTLLISLTIGTLTIYAGWTYTQVELWLANGFLTWYIWKLSTILVRIIAKKETLTPPAAGPPTA